MRFRDQTAEVRITLHLSYPPAFILVPSVLGGKVSQLGVWVGSGRFEPKEHRRRKDRATFVVGVLGGGIPVSPSPAEGFGGA